MLRERTKSFLPLEKRVVNTKSPDQEETSKQYALDTVKADTDEFHEAITKSVIKPADPKAAEEAHAQARSVLASAGALPENEFDSEFADYHRGVLAMQSKKPEEAEAIWKKLLARPKEERHYRSVWATFMLGKLGLSTESKDTTKWFQQCRALAKDGFADALGLAADSYGWEAKAELDADHREEAAKLYLTQLAIGDDTALISLKALIPDRGVIEGTMSFDENAQPISPDDARSASAADKLNASIEKALISSAKTPTLRWLQTSHVLATETTLDWVYQTAETDSSGTDKAPMNRCQRWLAALKAAGIKDVQDADRLGWVAYTSGDYAPAKEWLKLCPAATGMSRWLEAKLLRRDGKLDASIKAMQQSVNLLSKEDAAAPSPAATNEALYDNGHTKLHSARADLATLHLSHADFVEALAQFAQTDLTDDMAYVAELLLSADELKKFVDKEFPPSKKKTDAQRNVGEPDQDPDNFFRDLLGRRLVREDRYDEARNYLSPKTLPYLDDYVIALKKAADLKLPKSDRARAYFHAACVLTQNGQDLMATRGEPDSLGRGQTVTTIERETGKQVTRSENNKFVPADDKKVKFHVPVTKEEKKRLEQHKVVPFRYEHYRYVALGLVWKSAALLPDQSDELADILNSAGNWMKGDYRGDDEAAGKFFQAIERRASKTTIGKAACAKHWFVEDQGAWSSEEFKADDKNR